MENAEFFSTLTSSEARALMAEYISRTTVAGDLPFYEPGDYAKARAEGRYGGGTSSAPQEGASR